MRGTVYQPAPVFVHTDVEVYDSSLRLGVYCCEPNQSISQDVTITN